MKNFLILCAFLLVGCIPDNQSKESDSVKVVIAERVFKIPKGYFDGAKARGRDTESVVLEYSLPNFEVLPPYPQEREARQKLISEGRMKGMLLEAEKNRPSIEVSVQNLMEGRNFEKLSNAYELEKYSHIIPQASTQDQIYAPYIEDDFFIERNKNGSIKSYLRCSPRGQDKIPGCRHRFIDEGVIYSIRWRIQELPNWKQQQQAAVRFINNLEVKSNLEE